MPQEKLNLSSFEGLKVQGVFFRDGYVVFGCENGHQIALEFGHGYVITPAAKYEIKEPVPPEDTQVYEQPKVLCQRDIALQ